MRTVASKLLVFSSCLWLLGCGEGVSPASARAKEKKEWTFMIFLNGHNNLDRYGAINVNQLESVGSSKDVNFVVQWASAKNETTKRLYIEKDDDTKKVTSPVIEDMPRVDMGDYKELVKFVKWTAEHYPAKHYFIGLWNHGSGWHRKADGELFRDINVDDFTDNRMTTEQVGIAMSEASKVLGKKVDILGSDACLMAMLEVNEEFSKYVDVAVASEELIPALGWPYDALAKRWVAKPRATAAEVVSILTEEYQKQYLPGGPGEGLGEVTLSSVDLRKAPALYSAMRSLGDSIQKLDADNLAKVKEASEESQRFDTADYADLGDFLRLLEEKKIDGLGRTRVAPVRTALKSYIISNHVTDHYKLATGISFWLPTSSWSFDRYQERYRKLRFDTATGWSKTIAKILQ